MTARKTATARRAPAKKAAPATVEERTANFDEFRRRANGFTFTTQVATSRPPYVLGPEQGFTPPVVVAFPEKLTGQVQLDQCIRREDYFGALSVLLGGQLMRVVGEFDKYEDGMALLTGLVLAIIDHFTGPGASDVPGGIAAS